MDMPHGETMPNLMNEVMLKEAVMEQVSEDEVKRIMKQESIHFKETLHLRLEFKKIQRIHCLWEFTSLDRLNLNNNLIEKIEGLDRLLNLTWLNLSYNKLEKIEGLESLRKLEVLTLSNNRISVIENMDTLEKLTLFCIGNNLIGQLDNVLYLRKFKNLFSLNLCGNPASKEDDYKHFIAAYFPNLIFLDFKLLELQTKNDASVKYQNALEKMKLEELQQEQAENAEQKDDLEGFLKGSDLSESMLKFDPEAKTLRDVPGMAREMETYPFLPFSLSSLQNKIGKKCTEIKACNQTAMGEQRHYTFIPKDQAMYQHRLIYGKLLVEFFNPSLTFEHQMLELFTQIIESGLAENERRETEVNCFVSAQTKAMKDYQKKVSKKMADFEEQHQKRMVELQQISESDLLKDKISHCSDEIRQLCHSFMEMEWRHVSQMEDIIKMLDKNLSDMVGNFSETVQGLFTQCRDLEDTYYEKVRQVAIATLEKVAKGEVEEHMQDDAKALFTDRDAVMDALETAHENHLLRINDRQTQLLTRVSAWKVAVIEGVRDKELEGNRTRISDFHRYTDILKEQLEE
ncbi:dynein regulatory complex subunit 3 [Labrus mixtus]|uniref:dynein regulatory complex subunit 3 n=1 Tax=Labrus mixtus TaxID=508554 RepID=UPI0029C0EEA1|nr:dynein regulatory complex subunit 3 [Labrus mixtus]